MEYCTLHKAEDLFPFMPQLEEASEIALYAEMTGSNPHRDRLKTLVLACEGLPTLSIDCHSFLPEGKELLRDILSTSAIKVLHDAKVLIQFLYPFDIYLRPLFDTMLAAQLLYQPPSEYLFSLDKIAKQYLNSELSESDIERARILLQLRTEMIREIKAYDLVPITEIEFRCVHAIAHMEYYGINLDEDRWQELFDKTDAERQLALEELYKFSGQPMEQLTLWGAHETLSMNFDSPQFVLKLLNDNGISVSSTAKQELYPYNDHPLVKALSKYRKASKSLSAFLRPYPALRNPETGRLHPKYGQISTFSGRMSCQDPNIQQIPRDLAFRRCFTAPPGRSLIMADYPQIELRAAAQISGDERMLAACSKGDDLHLLTASLVTGKPPEELSKTERQSAKAVNFGLIYGMGPQGLQKYAEFSYGVPMTLDEATLFCKRFFDAYKGISRWHKELKECSAREGRTLTGRRFTFPHTPTLPELSNLPVQGSAADIIKKALGFLIEKIEGSDARIVAVVHDEILLECDEARSGEVSTLLASVMNDAAQSLLPQAAPSIETIVSESWAEK